MNLKEKKWLPHAAAVALIAACVLYVAKKSGVYVDDAFITLTYARSIAEGRGMVFNAGERVFGVTTVLWCWLNVAPFALMGAERVGEAGVFILSLAALFGAAVAIYRLGHAMGAGFGGLAGAVWLCLMPANITTLGMEYPLSLWLACEALLAFRAKRPVWAGVFLALVAMTRPDGILLGGIVVGAQFLSPDHRRAALRTIAATAALLIPFALFLTIYYGSPFSNTLQSKQAQLTAETTWWFVSMFSGTKTFLLQNFLRHSPVLAFLFFAGFAWLALTQYDHASKLKILQHPLTLALIWAAVHITALQVLGIPYYSWYLYPLWFAMALAMSAGAGALLRAASGMTVESARPAAVSLAAAVLLLAAVEAQAPWMGELSIEQRIRRTGYVMIAKEVNKLSEGRPVKIICHEIGVVGFYKTPNVYMVDEFYLIQPMGEHRLQDRNELIWREKPEYLVEFHNLNSQYSEEQKRFQEERESPDFILELQTFMGQALLYRPVYRFKRDGVFQILFELDELRVYSGPGDWEVIER